MAGTCFAGSQAKLGLGRRRNRGDRRRRAADARIGTTAIPATHRGLVGLRYIDRGEVMRLTRRSIAHAAGYHPNLRRRRRFNRCPPLR